MKSLLRKIYEFARRRFESLGIYLYAGKISVRNQPEAVNRALWKPFVVDDEWRTAYKRAQSLTNGDATDNIFRQCRLYSTLQMANYAAKLPAGDVIECGCWHGHSTVAIAAILERHGFNGRFHVFDSFEGGLSDFTAKDESSFHLSDREKRDIQQKFVSSYEFVASVTANFGFVDLHRGWIPAVFSSFQPRPLRFVHIDVDMYEPTLASLQFFWGSLVEGGCMVIDDYNHGVFEGATRAVDDFVSSNSMRQFYKVPFGSCYLIK
jgi:O-methyltransferase